PGGSRTTAQYGAVSGRTFRCRPRACWANASAGSSRASSCGSSLVSGETTSKRVSPLDPNSATLTMSPPPRRRCPIQRGRRDGVHRRARWTAQPGEHAMTSRAQHYREAERLLEALPPDKRADTLAMKARVLTLEEVQVHTMLATGHDDAYSE